MRKPRLMTPGPSSVPEEVLLELARPVIHHRSAEAKQVITEVSSGLKEVFQTVNDVLILPGTVVEVPGWFRVSLTASDEMVERSLAGFERARAQAIARFGAG